MSTKTIAVDTTVYNRLAAAKRPGESFSKTIARLLTTVAEAHTGADILRELPGMPALPDEDAEQFVRAIEENRATERWDSA